MLNCALPCCCVMFLLKLGVGRSYATLLCTYSLHKTDVEMGMRMWHEHGAVGGGGSYTMKLVGTYNTLVAERNRLLIWIL